MINFEEIMTTEPLAIKSMNDAAIQRFKLDKLVLDHPCHNQTVERHVKPVTEASICVTGFEPRDGMIRQKIKSRKLMPSFNTKKQFNC